MQTVLEGEDAGRGNAGRGCFVQVTKAGEAAERKCQETCNRAGGRKLFVSRAVPPLENPEQDRESKGDRRKGGGAEV